MGGKRRRAGKKRKKRKRGGGVGIGGTIGGHTVIVGVAWRPTKKKKTKKK